MNFKKILFILTILIIPFLFYFIITNPRSAILIFIAGMFSYVILNVVLPLTLKFYFWSFDRDRFTKDLNSLELKIESFIKKYFNNFYII